MDICAFIFVERQAAGHQNLVDVAANLRVFWACRARARNHALGIAVVCALRGDEASHGRIDREHDAVGRRAQRVFGQQGARCEIGLFERVVLPLLILNVVDPGARLGQVACFLATARLAFATASALMALSSASLLTDLGSIS